MHRATAAALIATAAIALGGCGSGGAGPTAAAGVGTVGSLSAGVVAQVGGERVSSAELARAVDQQVAQRPPNEPAPAPGSAAHDTARRSALQRLVAQRIYAIEAMRCGAPCRVGARQVQGQLDELERTEGLGSHAELMAYLRQLKFTLPDVRALIRARLQQARIAAHLTAPVRFSAAQALAYYRAHPAYHQNPELRTARHILIASEAEAIRIRARVTDANFAAMARRYSIDTTTKTQGGDLGTVLAGGSQPEFQRGLSSLALREISQPVKTRLGWEIIQVTTITPPRTFSFAELRSTIIASQLAVRRQAAVARWQTNVFEGWRKRTVYADQSLLPPPSAPVATGLTLTGAVPPASTSSSP
jgi:PPIC-type peptidyl-prolyl cis-trans isomerase-like protein/SurA-like protein